MIEDPRFEESWQRNVEESIRQGNVKPFIEEAVLQVSCWGFKISELQARKKQKAKDILLWLKSIYSQEEEELAGFLGPIHIWQVSIFAFFPPDASQIKEIAYQTLNRTPPVTVLSL